MGYILGRTGRIYQIGSQKSGSGNSFDGNHSAKYEVDIFGDNGYFFRLETDT